LVVSYHTVHAAELDGAVADTLISLIARSQDHKIELLLIVFILLQLTNVACFEFIAFVTTTFCTGFNDVVSNPSSTA
jgi:hypothetical protein